MDQMNKIDSILKKQLELNRVEGDKTVIEEENESKEGE